MISWNSRNLKKADPLVLLGIGYLFVSMLDVFHTLTYRGMMVFAESFDYATKFWIAARCLQSLTLVLFGTVLRKSKSLPFWTVFIGYSVVTLFFLMSILYWKIFPLCFVEGQGLTLFKKVSEYVISALLLISIFLVSHSPPSVPKNVRQLLIISIFFTVISELAFTFYVSSYGFSNLVGHYLKIGAFLFAYRALIANEIKSRLQHIRELTEAKDALAESGDALAETNRALQNANRDLANANAAKNKFFFDSRP